MNNTKISESLEQKRESFLAQACEAEAKKDFVKAERLFRLAMYCNGRICLDVTDAKKYVQQAGPVYKSSIVVVGSLSCEEPIVKIRKKTGNNDRKVVLHSFEKGSYCMKELNKDFRGKIFSTNAFMASAVS